MCLIRSSFYPWFIINACIFRVAVNCAFVFQAQYPAYKFLYTLHTSSPPTDLGPRERACTLIARNQWLPSDSPFITSFAALLLFWPPHNVTLSPRDQSLSPIDPHVSSQFSSSSVLFCPGDGISQSHHLWTKTDFVQNTVKSNGIGIVTLIWEYRLIATFHHKNVIQVCFLVLPIAFIACELY